LNLDISENARARAQDSNSTSVAKLPDIQERLFTHAEDYFSELIARIDDAKFQIDMEVYIFDEGVLGDEIAKALTRAAHRGVFVRLMTDGVGSNPHFHHIAKSLATVGVQVRIHRPLPWHIEHWRYAIVRQKGFKKLLFLLFYINRRNHRKMTIIDHQRIFLGSINVSQDHLEQRHGGKNWRDTAIEVSGLDLRIAHQAFDMNWNFARRRIKKLVAKNALNSPFLFNFSQSLRRANTHKLIQHIEQSAQRIWITNAYFVPDRPLMNSLIDAARRGVDVRILLPQRSDVFFMPWVSSFFYRELVRAGVKIYEYTPGMLHAKTILIDDWSTVGSSNMNRRSLMHDLEVDYVLQNEDSVNHLVRDFVTDQNQSQEQTEQYMKTQKRWHIWLGALVLILLGRWL
jgi:cardiolipin synthase A/B